MNLDELQYNLAQINKVVDIDTLLEQPVDQHSITNYYTKSQYWYRIFHSTQGAVHLALNFDGVFNKAGYDEQAKIVEHHLRETHSQQVLELASGQGFNTRYLARHNPTIEFVGLDLTPSHVRAAQTAARPHPNLNFHVGDFQHLPYSSEQFDTAFVVESFCHARNMCQALTEVHRVLRPGGRFIVFDGFRRAKLDNFDPRIQRATRLVEKAMMVGSGWVLDNWLTLAQTVGFEVMQVRDLSEAVVPNILRFERLSTIYFKSPSLTRWIYKQVPSLVTNAIPGRFMLTALRAGAHSYQEIILTRK